MPRVVATMRLDEKTVSKAETKVQPRHRKPRKKAENSSGPVRSVKPHDLIKGWMKKEGLDLRSGRVQVNSSEEIIVWNNNERPPAA